MRSSANGDVLPTLAAVGQFGLIMAGSTAGGLLAGRYLDRLFGTNPVLTLLLTLVGAVGGMVAVYRLAMRAVSDRPGRREQEDGRDAGEGRR